MDMYGCNTMPLWQNGPKPGAFYNFPGTNLNNSSIQMENQGDYGSKRAAYSYNNGTSVIGVVYKDGVIIAADELVSNGSLARYRNVKRVLKLSENVAIGASGDFADFQNITDLVNHEVVADISANDGHTKSPKDIYSRLREVMYYKRNNMTPLLCDVMVAGIGKDDEGNPAPFLGIVNRLGRAYEELIIGTNYGLQLAVPMLRASEPKVCNLDEKDAKAIIKKCMEVLYYRDCRAHPKYSMIVCNVINGITEESDSVDENWKLAEKVEGY